ncbi:uncharacterized protein [Scyliorhinus torazame]|uniref:uncharacterized protein isoform X2 n=1 Tax=Scyliorhinus torazame TaxID=75743 RepID=UPI003B594DFE
MCGNRKNRRRTSELAAGLLPKLLISFQPKVAAGDCKLENTKIVTEDIGSGGLADRKLKTNFTSSSHRITQSITTSTSSKFERGR